MTTGERDSKPVIEGRDSSAKLSCCHSKVSSPKCFHPRAMAFDGDDNDPPSSPEIPKAYEKADKDDECILCLRSDDHVLLLGEKLKTTDDKGKDLVAHYFCLLFACGLTQKGEEHEGIMGFLPKDIRRERKRGGFLNCMFCNKKGATAACSLQKCKSTYHVTCALTHNKPSERPLFQFTEPYKSFCKPLNSRIEDHRPTRLKLGADKIVEEYRTEKFRRVICAICSTKIPQLLTMIGYAVVQCQHETCHGYCHSQCLSKYAVTAGEQHFMCPHCNCHPKNVNPTDEKKNCHKTFLKKCRDFGIYIPSKDADWELEGNHFGDSKVDYNFGDHYRDYDQCDAKECLCPEPEGRKHDTDDVNNKAYPWYIVLCQGCGGSGIHQKCGNLSVKEIESWKCPLCASVLDRKETNTGGDGVCLRRGSEDPEPSKKKRKRTV